MRRLRKSEPPITGEVLSATSKMPPRTALLGVLGSWPYIRNQANTFYYQRAMGTDRIGPNLIAMLCVPPSYGALLMPLALYVPARKTRAVLLGLGAGSLAAAVACTWPSPPDPFKVLRPLPVFLLALAIGFGWWLIQSRDATRAQTVTRKLMLTVFAGLLLGRIALQTSVLDYGFVLAVPGTLILIVALLDWLPAWFGATDHRLVYTAAVLSVRSVSLLGGCPIIASVYLKWAV